MAFSKNQNQLTKHGEAVLGDELRKARTPTRSIAVWTRVNGEAADYGEQELGEPLPARALRGPVRRAGPRRSRESTPSSASTATRKPWPPRFALPDSLGRWEQRRKRVIDELNATAEPGLRRFGYL